MKGFFRGSSESYPLPVAMDWLYWSCSSLPQNVTVPQLSLAEREGKLPFPDLVLARSSSTSPTDTKCFSVQSYQASAMKWIENEYWSKTKTCQHYLMWHWLWRQMAAECCLRYQIFAICRLQKLQLLRSQCGEQLMWNTWGGAGTSLPQSWCGLGIPVSCAWVANQVHLWDSIAHPATVAVSQRSWAENKGGTKHKGHREKEEGKVQLCFRCCLWKAAVKEEKSCENCASKCCLGCL